MRSGRLPLVIANPARQGEASYQQMLCLRVDCFATLAMTPGGCAPANNDGVTPFPPVAQNHSSSCQRRTTMSLFGTLRAPRNLVFGSGQRFEIGRAHV